MPMDNDTRKRLWWKATRMSFAWERWRRDEGEPSNISRQEWARIIYRIFSQYPEESLKSD